MPGYSKGEEGGVCVGWITQTNAYLVIKDYPELCILIHVYVVCDASKQTIAHCPQLCGSCAEDQLVAQAYLMLSKQ